MGILYHNAKMLCEAHLRGQSFRQTLSIAHLSLYLHASEVKALCKQYGTRVPSGSASAFADYRFGDSSDRFFHDFLGVASLEILDSSPYQGATLIHDLNRPVAQDLWCRFDAVIDGGSLEHVFNFPVAIANLMRMLKVGGSIFISTPANNLCGHGFYQFSPEVMFRIFSSENGFELKRVVFLEASFPAVELTRIRRAYEVTDPRSVHRRVGLLSKFPVVMQVEATKTADVAPFTAAPQQSDYVPAWSQALPPPSTGVSGFLKRLVAKLPMSLQRRLRGHHERWQYSFSNSGFYKKLGRGECGP